MYTCKLRQVPVTDLILTDSELRQRWWTINYTGTCSMTRRGLDKGVTILPLLLSRLRILVSLPVCSTKYMSRLVSRIVQHSRVFYSNNNSGNVKFFFLRILPKFFVLLVVGLKDLQQNVCRHVIPEMAFRKVVVSLGYSNHNYGTKHLLLCPSLVPSPKGSYRNYDPVPLLWF